MRTRFLKSSIKPSSDSWTRTSVRVSPLDAQAQQWSQQFLVIHG